MKIAWILFLATCFSGMVLAGLEEGRKALDDNDYQTAMKQFSDLADTGDPKAMVQVGLFYYEGKGVKKDYVKAMDWFLKAFDKQDADAFVNIGVMHRDGQGVPVNKKMAYCVFLTTHMCGLGSESTQARANSCLSRLMHELPKEDIKDCLSNYTLQFMTAYIEARGKMKGIPAKYKPSKEEPALRDLDWWMEGELDALFGEPTPEEKKVRNDRAEQRENEREALRHTLVTQIKFSESQVDQYRSCGVITDGGMGSAPFRSNMIVTVNGGEVYERRQTIGMDQWRYVALESTDQKATLIYDVKHPSKPSPCGWSEWMKPTCSLSDSMDVFSLCNGTKVRSKSTNIPTNAPQIRFKVVKE